MMPDEPALQALPDHRQVILALSPEESEIRQRFPIIPQNRHEVPLCTASWGADGKASMGKRRRHQRIFPDDLD